MRSYTGGKVIDKKTNINEFIRAAEVRTVDDEGNQLGVIPIREALAAAEERGLDLVEVAPGAKPPVCKIMDYGKYKYEMNKKAQEAKKKQTVVVLKEIKFRPKIDEHDFQFKVRHAFQFLGEGNKVKISVMFRGREMAYMNQGRQILDRVAEEAKELANVEYLPKIEGRNMFMILAPKKTQ